jgi:hypothetical protein
MVRVSVTPETPGEIAEQRGIAEISAECVGGGEASANPEIGTQCRGEPVTPHVSIVKLIQGERRETLPDRNV